jgi:hypothetical protein
MSDKKISELPVITGADLADADLFVVVDVSADQTKSISRTELLDGLDIASGSTPTFGIANMTLDDSSLVVVDTTNMQTFADGVDSALLKARGTGFTSTYVSTVAVGGTTFAQPAVNGEIYSDQGYFAIAYAGATGITVATLSSPSTYVYIDNVGNLQQQTSAPTRQDWSRKIFTMRISVDTSAETILGFEYLGNPIGHYANSDRDIYTALLAQGIPFKVGQVITGRAGDLGFDVGAGTIMEYGGTGDINNPNLLSLDASANVTYSLLSRTAIVGDQTNLVKFWDNAGSITALGSGTFVGHRLYRFSNGNFAIQYGQGNYANLILARAGILLEEYVLNERLQNATFFGWWIIGETATNTGGTTLTEFREYTIGVQGGSSSGLAGCLLRGNDLSDILNVGNAQVNLDLEPGVDVQAYSSVLQNTTASYTTTEETKIAESLPASLGTAAQVLTVNAGATAAEWAAAGGGGTALELYAENPSSPTAPSATGTNAVAIGNGAKASSSDAIGIGPGAWARGSNVFAVFGDARAISSLAIGLGSLASQNYSVALGRDAFALADSAITIGKGRSSGDESLSAAIGNNSASYGASGANAVAIGDLAKATAANSIAIGDGAISTTANLIALGGTVDSVQISGAYTLPTSDGTAGQVLSTDGSGNLSWITP